MLNNTAQTVTHSITIIIIIIVVIKTTQTWKMKKNQKTESDI